MTPPPFIVFALPRSRTAWLSRFLSYAEWQCGHDEIRHCRSLEDVRAWLSQPYTGTVETAAAPFWRLLQQYQPAARIMVVRRPVAEVVDSLMRLGLPFDAAKLTTSMRLYERKLDQIEHRLPHALSVTFADLATERTCAAVFEHCLLREHDPAWWARIAPVNLQINMAHLMRYYLAHAGQLDKLALTAKQQMLAGMMRGAGPDLDGMTIQQEPFDTFYRDGTALFAEHFMQTGQAPDAHLGKNVPLMRTLEQIGALQVTTARSNGRMFGYLMAIISPSLDGPEILSGIHTATYASPLIPRLGMKLQRASIAALRERGATEIIFRAGTRGSGPRMGTMFRRLGAQDHGHLFQLDLKEH